MSLECGLKQMNDSKFSTPYVSENQAGFLRKKGDSLINMYVYSYVKTLV